MEMEFIPVNGKKKSKKTKKRKTKEKGKNYSKNVKKLGLVLTFFLTWHQ